MEVHTDYKLFAQGSNLGSTFTQNTDIHWVHINSYYTTLLFNTQAARYLPVLLVIPRIKHHARIQHRKNVWGLFHSEPPLPFQFCPMPHISIFQDSSSSDNSLFLLKPLSPPIQFQATPPPPHFNYVPPTRLLHVNGIAPTKKLYWLDVPEKCHKAQGIIRYFVRQVMYSFRVACFKTFGLGLQVMEHLCQQYLLNFN